MVHLLLLSHVGDEFRGLVKVFLKNAFLKGVPSIFVRLKEHYMDREKVGGWGGGQGREGD